MLSDIRIAISAPMPENRDFCFKREALTINMLRQRSFVKKAERAVDLAITALLHCDDGPVALQ